MRLTNQFGSLMSKNHTHILDVKNAAYYYSETTCKGIMTVSGGILFLLPQSTFNSAILLSVPGTQTFRTASMGSLICWHLAGFGKWEAASGGQKVGAG